MTKTKLHLDDSLKMLRESLCAVQLGAAGTDRMTHADRIGRIIAEIDRQRPLGPNGKHGDLHTPTCGCSESSDALCPGCGKSAGIPQSVLVGDNKCWHYDCYSPSLAGGAR